MDDKLMNIPNNDEQNYPYIDQNYWLQSLDTNKFEPIKHNSMKVPKVLELTKIPFISIQRRHLENFPPFFLISRAFFSLNVYLKDLSRVPLEGLVQSNGRDDWFPLLVGEMGEGRLSAFLLPFSTLTQLSKQYGKGWVHGE